MNIMKSILPYIASAFFAAGCGTMAHNEVQESPAQPEPKKPKLVQIAEKVLAHPGGESGNNTKRRCSRMADLRNGYIARVSVLDNGRNGLGNQGFEDSGEFIRIELYDCSMHDYGSKKRIDASFESSEDYKNICTRKVNTPGTLAYEDEFLATHGAFFIFDQAANGKLDYARDGFHRKKPSFSVSLDFQHIKGITSKDLVDRISDEVLAVIESDIELDRRMESRNNLRDSLYKAKNAASSQLENF